MHLRILADDLTGALDSAAAFCVGPGVPVWLTPPSAYAAGADSAPVQALSIGSRDLPTDALQASLQSALPWLQLAPSTASAPTLVFKKIDSLMRGNTFAEIAWLLRHGAWRGAVLAPAYPAQGRFTRAGRHWVGKAYSPDSVASDSASTALLDALAAVGLRGRHWDGEALPDTVVPGEVLVPDALTDAALAHLAALSATPAARRWLWCGSAGLATAMALQGRRGVDHAQPSPTARHGRALAVTASWHPVLRAQLRQLPAHWRILAPAASETETALAIDAAHHEGTLLIDLALPPPATATDAHEHLMHWTRHIVAALPRPETLVVIGGDTLLALCQASDATSLLAGPAPRPGWGSAHIEGGAWHGAACHTRSGAFGAPDDLADLLRQCTPHPHEETKP